MEKTAFGIIKHIPRLIRRPQARKAFAMKFKDDVKQNVIGIATSGAAMGGASTLYSLAGPHGKDDQFQKGVSDPAQIERDYNGYVNPQTREQAYSQIRPQVPYMHFTANEDGSGGYIDTNATWNSISNNNPERRAMADRQRGAARWKAMPAHARYSLPYLYLGGAHPALPVSMFPKSTSSSLSGALAPSNVITSVGAAPLPGAGLGSIAHDRWILKGRNPGNTKIQVSNAKWEPKVLGYDGAWSPSIGGITMNEEHGPANSNTVPSVFPSSTLSRARAAYDIHPELFEHERPGDPVEEGWDMYNNTMIPNLHYSSNADPALAARSRALAEQMKTVENAQEILLHEGNHALYPYVTPSFIPVSTDKSLALRIPPPWEKDTRRGWSYRLLGQPVVKDLPSYAGNLPEFLRAIGMIQNMSQATYGHRLQDQRDLKALLKLYDVYGTKWLYNSKHLDGETAEALDLFRAVADERAERKYETIHGPMGEWKKDMTEEEKDALFKRRDAFLDWLEEHREEPQDIYDLIDEMDLWKQTRNNNPNSNMDKTASVNYSIEHVSLKGNLTKQAATSTMVECQDIMNRIYSENPSYWPYGLNTAGHDDLYIIRDKMTKKACGFVGWQEQRHGRKLVGSYTIGVLPEFRGAGFAKEAVAKIVQQKSAGVDEVRAYVVNGNTPSEALANSLSIPVVKKF